MGDGGTQLHEASQDVPPGLPLYDLQTTFPYFYEPRNPAFELLEKVKEEDPDTYQNFLDSMDREEEEPPHPGARQIVHWETNLVRATCHARPAAVTAAMREPGLECN